jgi:DNA polymerase-3 subunit alpha
MKYAPVLEGLPRNPGIHAAGVVIGEKPLIEIVPLCRDKSKEVVTQYEMTPIGDVGLLKMDFLGLKTLTIIQEAVRLVKVGHGVAIDVDKLDLEDKDTLSLYGRGDTVAVFQFESSGMQEMLRRVGISRFEDTIAMNALYRPGPMQFIDEFGNRKNGKSKVEYDHPLLESILKETYGFLVYQEQVMQAVGLLAGFSMGQSDNLRRAMGKKKAEEIAAMRALFVKGCHDANKIAASLAGRIFDNIEKFAGYGFNKSHSAAYAMVAWQTAWLKAHYPVEFMAANLTIEISNNDRIAQLIAECQALDMEILPPAVNESGLQFTPVRVMKDGVEINAIRFGLAGVKNVGQGAVEEIIKERTENGPFKGLTDFCKRVNGHSASKKVLESLVKCGAFDFTKISRARLFNGVDHAMKSAESARRDKAAGQSTMFDMMLGGGGGKEETDETTLPKADPWPQSQELAGEKELLGFYVSGHPLLANGKAAERYSLARTSEEFAKLAPRAGTRIAGLVTAMRKVFTKKDQPPRPMAIFQLERLDGKIEVVAFPDAFQEYGVHLVDEAPVLICGEKQEGDVPKMQAQEIYPLAEAYKYFATRLAIHLTSARADEHIFGQIKATLRAFPGMTPVVISIEFPGGEKVFIDTDRTYKVTPGEKLVRDLEHFLGEDTVYIDVNSAPCLRPKKPRWER